MPDYPNIFTPMTLGAVRFKNRIFASPTSTTRVAERGAPSQNCIDYYETNAWGGFGQVTVTESFIDFDYAARHDHGLDFVSPNRSSYHLDALTALSGAIKRHGAVASVQMNHAGAINHPNALGGKNPIGPSKMKINGIQVDEMDEEMILRVAENFANACGNVKACGFDMVMLHGGHGWLLSQFLSPLLNKRTDKWGGSIENRSRFASLVLDKVREAVGSDFLIEYRMSGAERVEGGLELAEAIEFARIIQGKVDLLHITSGIYHSHVETKSFSSMFHDHGCNLDLAAAIKKNVNKPVVAVGGFNNPDQIERAIGDGLCDFVAMGRQQKADPMFVRKAMEGRSDEIAPCLRCSCFNPLPPNPELRKGGHYIGGHQEVCAVNPMLSFGAYWKNDCRNRKPKDILVIGGGVAGLYAALTAAENGHSVVLVEKTGKLGGHLWITDYDSHKEDMRLFRDSLIVRTKRSGVDIRLNTEADGTYIRNSKPDAVICCVGSVPIVPDIPGIEKARQILRSYTEFDQLGRRIVIIGGGLVGCEAGYHLQCKGKQVHLVEMLDELAQDAYLSHKQALLPRMKESGMTWDVGTTCTEIADNGIRVLKADGSERFIEADTILYATGMKGSSELAEHLRAESGCACFVPAGDCIKARKLEQAVFEGYTAAMDL